MSNHHVDAMKAVGDVFYIFWALQRHRMEHDVLFYAPVNLRERYPNDRVIDFDIEDLLKHIGRDGAFDMRNFYTDSIEHNLFESWFEFRGESTPLEKYVSITNSNYINNTLDAMFHSSQGVEDFAWKLRLDSRVGIAVESKMFSKLNPQHNGISYENAALNVKILDGMQRGLRVICQLVVLDYGGFPHLQPESVERLSKVSLSNSSKIVYGVMREKGYQMLDENDELGINRKILETLGNGICPTAIHPTDKALRILEANGIRAHDGTMLADMFRFTKEHFKRTAGRWYENISDYERRQIILPASLNELQGNYKANVPL